MSLRTDPPDSADGLSATAKRVAGSLSGLLSARLELASLEWIEERERLQLRLGLLVGGVLLLGLAALTLAVLLIVVFWDTHRIAAILAVFLLCAGGGALLLLRAQQIGRLAGPPFAATRAEFIKDRAAFAHPEAPAAAHSVDRARSAP